MTKLIAQQIAESIEKKLRGISTSASFRFDADVVALGRTEERTRDCLIIYSTGEPQFQSDGAVGHDEYTMDVAFDYGRYQSETDTDNTADNQLAIIAAEIFRAIMADEQHDSLALWTREWSTSKAPTEGSGENTGTTHCTVRFRTLLNDPFNQ